MKLFSHLFNLDTNSKENYFTEIVAYLFRTTPEILYEWLEYIDLLDKSSYIHTHIVTQPRHDALEHHLMGSRPDIKIELSANTYVDVVYIESKIDAEEHNDQLQRYAEHLDTLQNIRKKILLYVTRNFDPKNEEDVLKGVPKSAVQFEQTRWWTLYQVLQSQPKSTLLDEIIAFMKEHGMGENSQFTADDIEALSHLPKSYPLMKDLIIVTLEGKVRRRFEEVVGTIERPEIIDAYLKEYGRYLIFAHVNHAPKYLDMWCGLGYHLDQNLHSAGIPGSPPTVSLILEVSPQSRQRQTIIKDMGEISRRPGWRGYKLNELTSWSGVICERKLEDFLSEKDQVGAISTYFWQLLDELTEIKKQYPAIDWSR